jgi:hypothetical protein
MFEEGVSIPGYPFFTTFHEFVICEVRTDKATADSASTSALVSGTQQTDILHCVQVLISFAFSL